MPTALRRLRPPMAVRDLPGQPRRLRRIDLPHRPARRHLPGRSRHCLRPLPQRPHRLDLTPDELTGETTKRPAGVSRWVNAHGKISLAGFSCPGRAHVRGRASRGRGRGRADRHPAPRRGRGHACPAAAHRQADRAPRAPVAARARDATAGLTVTRLADAAGHVSRSRCPSSPPQSSCPRTARSSGSTRSGTTEPASSARSPTPKGRPRRKNSAIGNVA